MEKEKIKKLVKLFMEANGYKGKETDIENAIIFSRPTGLGTKDEWIIYFYSKEKETPKELETLCKKYPNIPGGENGRRIFLSIEPLGVPPPFVKENEFIYQVPVWFFDREFSEAKTRTPLKELENETKKYVDERIPQPYIIDNKRQENDLLETILNNLDKPSNPCLTLIIAPAGYGKTVLMVTLYKELRERFISNKQRQKMGKRPLLMLPGHIKRANDLDGLINNFIGDEYDYGVTNKEVFKFWIKYGFAVWLLDGVEELILKIPEEFLYQILEEYILAPDSTTPQVVLTLRKPLLSTVPELMETIEEYKEMGIKMYELTEWEVSQQKIYFNRNLRLPEEEKREFILEIERTPQLKNLGKVPYFCNIIADLKNNNEMGICRDECELVEYAFNKFCEREFTKGLDREIWSVEKQKELFIILAEILIEKGEISTEDLLEYARMIENRSDQLECLKRHALLTIKGENKINFVHEILKEYLISCVLIDALKRCMLEIFKKVGEIEIESFKMKNLLKYQLTNWPEIINNLGQYTPQDYRDEALIFRNIMKIYLLSNTENKENEIRTQVQNKNLTGLLFKNLNLEDFDFSHSNLKNVSFEKCNLQNVKFDHCIFDNTYISADCQLNGATTRNATFYSIRTENKTLYEYKEIIEYFHNKTKVPPEMKVPCQAAINVRKILEKAVKKGKGNFFPLIYLKKTKCGGGVPADKIIEKLRKMFTIKDEYIRIRNDLFSQIKKFVDNPSRNTAPDFLLKALDELCRDAQIGCTHLPE